MPIKGLSESIRLARLGTIHLGYRIPVKGKDGVLRPDKADHFVFPPELLPLVKSVYGTEQPKALDVLIPVEMPEIFASQWYRSYADSWGLVCRGDGETATRTIDHKTGKIAKGQADIVPEQISVPCQGPDCEIYKAKGCSEGMYLQVMIPKLPGVGIWQIFTGSKNSIININSDIAMIRHIVGRIALVPLTLTLEPAEGKDPGTGKKRSFYTLHLRVSGSLGQLLADAKKPLSMLEMPRTAIMPDEDGMPDVDADEEPPTSSEQWDAMKSAAKPVTVQPKPAPVTAETPNPPPQVVKVSPAAPSAEIQLEKPIAEQWETFYGLTGRNADKENSVMAQFANKHGKGSTWFWKRDISRIELAQVISVLEERARKNDKEAK